jgi:hypothetical protein
MRVCVFCGSAVGAREEYAAAARDLAGELARRKVGLVYGGGSVGLMGVPLASRELAHAGLTEMRVVASMHERKATMASLVDGFIALPGGLGTFEETLEILTWSQLGIHDKPVGVLNVAGYYDGLLRMLGHAMREGFVHRENLALLLFADTAADLLDQFETWKPPAVARAWLDPSQI